MVSRFAVLSLIIFAIVGCGKDENSPEMGAVPPKPNPDIISKMPPELRARMQGAKPAMDAQTSEMGRMAKHAQGKK